MSPTSKELVSNKSLTGVEYAKILLSDFAAMLESHGLLNGHMAFGRVSHEIRLTLHLDLPSLPLTTDSVRSRPRSVQEVAANPVLAVIEPTPPLAAPSPAAILTSDELHRDITSPNVTRLEHGLPVDVSTRDQDGHITERQVQYPRDYPGLESIPPTMRDVTAEERAALTLPPDASDELISTVAEELRRGV